MASSYRVAPWFDPVVLFFLVLACFSPVLDNFFAGDDFNWLHQAAKALRLPSTFFATVTNFLRPTELAYFVLPTALFGFHAWPFFALLVAIHCANAVLVWKLLLTLDAGRLAALSAALFWALNYKHVEAVMRPYAVADSAALLGGLIALLLVLDDHPWLACLALVPAILAKENAVIFPALAMVLGAPRGRRWQLTTLPMWGVVAVYLGLMAGAGSTAHHYLKIDAAAMSRGWEILIALAGPDTTWLREVALHGQAQLLPGWLSVLLVAPLGWLLWRAPHWLRQGLLWTLIAITPTLFVPHQSSRYAYIPLVGVALIFGPGLARLQARLTPLPRRWPVVVMWAAIAALAAFFLVGIHHEEADYAHMGELHRRAAEAFRAQAAPTLLADPQQMVLFSRSPSMELLRSLAPPRPWYAPETYKWIFRRSYGVLGMANTYGFVTYCANPERVETLFVAVPRAAFTSAVRRGEFQLVIHDIAANHFAIAGPAIRAEVAARALANDQLYQVLQPGVFDPSFAGVADLEAD